MNEDHDLIVKTATLVEVIHDRLFGDGQTGELPVIKRDVDGLKQYRAKIAGALGLLYILITVFGVALFKLWGKF